MFGLNLAMANYQSGYMDKQRQSDAVQFEDLLDKEADVEDGGRWSELNSGGVSRGTRRR